MNSIVRLTMVWLALSVFAMPVRAQEESAPRPPAHRRGMPAPPMLSEGPNVKVEATIRDQQPGHPVVTKVVSVVVASGEQGRVRTTAQGSGLPVPTPLNVDVHPLTSGAGRILLRISLEYGARGERPEEPPVRQGEVRVGPPVPASHTMINESIAVVLEDGKPLTVTQSADPVTARTVTVEVKATVLK